MKINKSILAAMTALSLFATSVTTVTPVIANAATRKTAAKKVYKFEWILKVVSKGHATHYFATPGKTLKLTKKQAKMGWSFSIDKAKGYKLVNGIQYYRLRDGVDINLSPGIATFVSKTNQPIKDSVFLGEGTHRISKAEFTKILNQQTPY